MFPLRKIVRLQRRKLNRCFKFDIGKLTGCIRWSKIAISGSSSDPLYIRPTDWNALKDYVNLEGVSCINSSDFLAAFGDLTSNQSFWESQTQFSSSPYLFCNASLQQA